MFLSRRAKIKFLRRVASYCTSIPEFKKWPLNKKAPFESQRLKKKLNIKRFSTPKRDLNLGNNLSQNARIFPMAIVKMPQNSQDLLIMPLNHHGFDDNSSKDDIRQSVFKDSLNKVVENTTDIMKIVQCLTMLDFKTNTIDFNEESIEVREIRKDKSIKKNIAQSQTNAVPDNSSKIDDIDAIEEILVQDEHKIEKKIKNANTVKKKPYYNTFANAPNGPARTNTPTATVKKDIPEVETKSIENIVNNITDNDITDNDITDNDMTDLNTQQDIIEENVASSNMSETIKTENIAVNPRPPPILMPAPPIEPVHVEREHIANTIPTPSSASLDIAKIATKELAKIVDSDQLAQNNIPSIRDLQLKLVLDLPDLKEIAKMKKENRPKNLLVNFNVHFNGVANLKLDDVEKALSNSNDVNEMSSGLASSICTLALKNFIAANNNKIPAITNKSDVFTTDCKIKDTQYSIAIKKNLPVLPNEASPK